MRFAAYAVMFGAGASFGAGDVSPHAPPLGSQLYDALIDAFPSTWGALIEPDEEAALRHPDVPFEKGMGLIWARNDSRTQLLVTDLGLYFTRFEPTGETDCYARLLQMLRLRNVLARTSFASLNYDCIFELAAARQGLTINYDGARSPRRELPLVKPHGSCNFVMQGLGHNVQMTNVRMAGIGTAYYDGPLEARAPSEMAQLYAAGPSMPPAISLYAPGKPSPMAPTALAQLRDRWSQAVEAATVVVVIGARVVLADSHVWDPVTRGGCDVWYVGVPVGPDFRIFEARLGGRLTMFADTFDAAVSRLDSRLRLLA
jgi:hypothetical protein